MINTIVRLLKKRYLIFLLLMTAAFALAGEIYHFFILSNIRTMTISLNYPGAEQGLNPDGSRFNISEMSNDEIIDEAKSGLEMNKMTNAEIKDRLFITSKISQRAIDNVVSDIRDGMEGSYIPTTYYIYYSQKDKLAKNETYEFLLALAESYEKYFTRRHAENNSILDYTTQNNDFSDYDYSEIYNILYNRSEQMLTLIQSHKDENRGFRADDNLNFDTVSDELSNFKNVRLEKFYAYVIQNEISKNRPEYLNKLSYLIDKSTLSYRKNMESSEIIKNALKKYDPQITAVAFIPSFDNTNSYYMSRTKTGIDDLARDSYADGMNAAKIAKKLDRYKNQQDKLEKVQNTSADKLSETDAYLAELLNDFEQLSKKVLRLDNEYLEYKTENYFSYKIVGKSRVISLPVIKKFAVLGFVFAILIILYMEFVHRIVHKKTKTAKKAFTTIKKMRGGE